MTAIGREACLPCPKTDEFRGSQKSPAALGGLSSCHYRRGPCCWKRSSGYFVARQKPPTEPVQLPG